MPTDFDRVLGRWLNGVGMSQVVVRTDQRRVQRTMKIARDRRGVELRGEPSRPTAFEVQLFLADLTAIAQRILKTR